MRGLHFTDEKMGTERSKAVPRATQKVVKPGSQPRQPGSEFLLLTPSLQQTSLEHCIVCAKHGADWREKDKKRSSP